MKRCLLSNLIIAIALLLLSGCSNMISTPGFDTYLSEKPYYATSCSGLKERYAKLQETPNEALLTQVGLDIYPSKIPEAAYNDLWHKNLAFTQKALQENCS